MTGRLFLEDPYLESATATVVSAEPGVIVLDRTPFYARSGGQPGDRGSIIWASGGAVVTEAAKGEAETIRHLVAEGASLPAPGTQSLPTSISRSGTA